MTETPTPQVPETNPTQPDPFEDVDFMQKASEASRLKILEEASYPEPPENDTDVTPAEEDMVDEANDTLDSNRTLRHSGRRRPNLAVAAGALVAVAGVTTLAAAGEADPTFSDETKPAHIESGDGLEQLAGQIEGVGTEDIRAAVDRIESMPVNIDALKDGLQPSDSIEIPTKVEK